MQTEVIFQVISMSAAAATIWGSLRAFKQEIKQDMKDLRHEMKDLRQEMREGFHRIDGEMKDGFHRIDGEMKDLRQDMKELRLEMKEGFRRVGDEFHSVREEIKELRTGVNRIEGAVMWKDHIFKVKEEATEKPEKAKKAK